ncbi:MAG: DUF2905 domain-containing protein [Chlamydiota bacterium]
MLILVGFFLILLGVLFHFGWLSKMGRLPGDIVIRKDNFTLFLPVTTSIIISAIVSVLLFLFRK